MGNNEIRFITNSLDIGQNFVRVRSPGVFFYTAGIQISFRCARSPRIYEKSWSKYLIYS